MMRAKASRAIVIWAVFSLIAILFPAITMSAESNEWFLRFVHFSDTQIADEESPARAVRAESIVGAAWRPMEAYGSQTLEATLGIINGINNGSLEPHLPFDFAIQTGDAVDNVQQNELNWFIKTMDGTPNENILPDSGEADGIRRPIDASINPKLPFQSRGIEIPWYSVFGNHDALAQGNFRIQHDDHEPRRSISPLSRLFAKFLGFKKIGLSHLEPVSGLSPAVIVGEREPKMDGLLGIILKALQPGAIVPDNSRHFFTRRQFMEAHFYPHSTSLPDGHGFTEENLKTGDTWYSARPVASVPVRIIAIDTVKSDKKFSKLGHSGELSRHQFQSFIVPEVEKARANGEYVIFASHHPSSDFGGTSLGGKISTTRWRRFLSSQPHVLAHICGHTHRHHARVIKGKFSYLEIETGSVIDYPQEARVIEIYRNRKTKNIEIQSRIIGHMAQPTALSRESNRRAVIDFNQWRQKIKAGVREKLDLTDLFLLPEEELELRPWNQYQFTPEEIAGTGFDRSFSVVLEREGNKNEATN